jgi:hypothetical protein
MRAKESKRELRSFQSFRACTVLTLEPFLGSKCKKYKRSTLHNFSYTLCLTCIYYKINLRDTLLYSMIS